MRRPKDVGASVQARLLNLARQSGEDYQLLLTRFANERLLYRLSVSDFADRFVVKGATLFTLWTGAPHRATRDVDLLGFGEWSEERVAEVFGSILRSGAVDDGLQADLDSVAANPIREDQRHGGLRVTVQAGIGTARLWLQVDVGVGDAITPAPIEAEFPTILDFPPPRLRAYPREAVVAEKLDAMVQLGLANSRMKDFYDLHVLSRTFEFDGSVLVRAIRATFERRRTELPRSLPVALTREFVEDDAKRTQWAAFVRKSTDARVGSWVDVMASVRAFVEAPLLAASGPGSFDRRWTSGAGWS